MRFTVLTVVLVFLAASSGCATPAGCTPTQPLLLTPPDDEAISGPPTEGYYFVNEDRTIWASAWFVGADEMEYDPGEGIKVGWFRPAGETLLITGRRLDGAAPPLEAHIPCCYPTRFQATGLVFSTLGCWEVTATAGESSLTFKVTLGE